MHDNTLLLLDAKGESVSVDSIEEPLGLPGYTTPESIEPEVKADISNAQTVIIHFESSADGRGFSLARYLRLRLGFQGVLYAMGEIIPDQVRMALDCGCDGVLVSAAQCERYGKENWLASNAADGTLGYWSNSFANNNRAWARRAGVTGPAAPF